MSAFDISGLVQLAKTCLGLDLFTIASHLDDKKTLAFKLVTWAVASDKGGQLLEGALREKKDSPALREFKATLAAPRTDELLNPLNFDLELLEATCRDAIDESPDPRLVLFLLREAESQLIDSLEKRFRGILGASPLPKKLSIEATVREFDGAVVIASGYRRALAGAHVLCHVSAVRTDGERVAKLAAKLRDAYPNHLDHYLLVLINGCRGCPLPAGTVELPPPAFKNAVFIGWARGVSEARSLGLVAELAEWLKARSLVDDYYSLQQLHAALDTLRDFLGRRPPPEAAEVKIWLAG